MPDKNVDLSTMVGGEEEFRVGNKVYYVKPLKLKDVDKFNKDGVNLGPQLFTMVDKKSREIADKWLNKQVLDDKGNPMSIQKAIDDDWTLVDLRNCMRKLVDISG